MKLYSRVEAAGMLGVGLTTLDKLRKEGKLGYYQATPGGKVKFTRAQLDAYCIFRAGRAQGAKNL